MATTTSLNHSFAIRVPVGMRWLHGEFQSLKKPRALVLLADRDGDGTSPINRAMAAALRRRHVATLSIGLQTSEETSAEDRTNSPASEAPIFAARFIRIIDWLQRLIDAGTLPIGLFGTDTVAAGALMAAALRPAGVAAVVACNGRPDLAEAALPHVAAPTLLIVGGLETPTIDLNRRAMKRMPGAVVLDVVSGATCEYGQSGAVDTATDVAAEWFERYLVNGGSTLPAPLPPLRVHRGARWPHGRQAA